MTMLTDAYKTKMIYKWQQCLWRHDYYYYYY